MKTKMALAFILLFLFFLSAQSMMAASINIKVGHDMAEKSPHHEAALKWKELVEQRTKGQVEVKVFPAQLLGTGTEMVEMLQAGALEVGIIPSAKVAPLVSSIQILDLPFLFPSREICYQVIDGKVGDEILKPLRNVNIEGVCFWESGFKQLTGSFPIRKPADYNGKKIRVMPAPVIMEQFKAFGATPVPLDFTELYNALQQRVVDGQENPLVTNITMKFYEVQKYLTMSDHAYLSYVFMFSKKFLESLPAETRRILVDTSMEARNYERKIIADNEKSYLEIMKKAGMEIIYLTPAERKVFADASKPVHQWFAKKYGDAALNMVIKEMERVRK
jgi:tripartite ATP-independent transporter DctP family solute receptor